MWEGVKVWRKCDSHRRYANGIRECDGYEG